MNRKMVGVLVVLVIVGGIVVISAMRNDSKPGPEGQSQQQQTQDQSSEQQDTEASASVLYRYVAHRGDSYPLMCRKAVQAYAKKHNVPITEAGIIFAETNMTNDAGSPQLEIGQQVDISEQTLKQWVDRAQALTDRQQAAWNYYVQFANFNTDHVGVPR